MNLYPDPILNLNLYLHINSYEPLKIRYVTKWLGKKIRPLNEMYAGRLPNSYRATAPV
jgi:hypothetical protein